MQLLLLLACAGEQDWSTAQDCEGLSPTQTRDECLASVGVLIATTDLTAGEALIEQIEDPLTRDYAWHTLTRDIAPESYTYCNRIENEKLVERCKSIVSRPHMHEHLKNPGVESQAPRGKAPPKGPPGQEGGPINPPPPGSKPPPPGGTLEPLQEEPPQ